VPLAIVHRDVSPQNLLVSVDGAVKVSDFGIARAADNSLRTAAGVQVGKLSYMAPEQAQGMAVANMFR
jgi:serine/threonine protein kinase